MIQGWLNLAPSSEKLLSQYFSTGDKTSLKLLVAQFNVSLYHYLLTQSDKETAEDVVQTTWLKVMKSSANPVPTNVKAWLFTIARNTLIDELRRQNKWQVIELQDEHMTTQNVEKTHQQKQQLMQFNSAIEQLPFHQREAFVFQQEGFSVIEITELTSASFETVKSRLRYARNHIKNTLEAQS